MQKSLSANQHKLRGNEGKCSAYMVHGRYPCRPVLYHRSPCVPSALWRIYPLHFSFLARYIVPTDHGGMRAWWCVFAEVKAAVPVTVRWTHRVISNRPLTIHLENLIDNNFCWTLTAFSIVRTLCSRPISGQTKAGCLPGACSMIIYSALPG